MVIFGIPGIVFDLSHRPLSPKLFTKLLLFGRFQAVSTYGMTGSLLNRSKWVNLS